MIFNTYIVPLINEFFHIFRNEHDVHAANAQLIDYQEAINNQAAMEIRQI